ncbi:MAG TPA: anhydro-N-acetylmuramic acid kinase [Pirellulales bacterium]|nr:anhydro-N-acetylmuramic acid kinase [Pirellulales bacterium]
MPPAHSSLLARGGLDRCRFFIGLAVSHFSRQVRGVLLATVGRGLEARVEIIGHRSLGMSRRIGRAIGRHRGGRPAIASLLGAELAEVGATLVGELCAPWPQLERRLLAIGLVEPGIWGRSRGGLIGYLPTVDAARLADLSGVNVIDAFPSRDLAQEGAGGPLDPLPDWLLLHHAAKTRVVIDLARDVRLSFLPATRDASGAERVGSWTLAPGLRLLDGFARRAGGHRRFDDGGHLAVQGRCLDALIERWQNRGGLTLVPGPRWRPRLGKVRSLLDTALTDAPRADWSIADLLCTATHWIAREIAETIRHRLPPTPAVDEVVLSGGGQQNGLLVRLLGEQLPGVPLVAEAELGIAANLRGAAVAAVLAMWHIDGTPGCPTAISGARTPRVLGRLTPGGPQAWQRLLREMVGHQPAVVSLRSAI